jgi:hypothetical protein
MGAYLLGRIFPNPFIYFSLHALHSGLNFVEFTLECLTDTCPDCRSSSFREEEEVEGVEKVREEEEVEKVEVPGGEGGRVGHNWHLTEAFHSTHFQ